MAYCTNCGKPIDGSAFYCSECGAPINAYSSNQRDPSGSSSGPQGEKTTQNNNNENFNNESFKNRAEKEARDFMYNKDPFIAAILSFVFPGLGQLYNGEFKKGLFFQIAYILVWMATFIFFGFSLGLIVILIFTIYDAYTDADKMRKGIEPVKNASLKEIMMFLLWPILLIAGTIILLTVLVIAITIIAFLVALFAVIFNIAV